MDLKSIKRPFARTRLQISSQQRQVPMKKPSQVEAESLLKIAETACLAASVGSHVIILSGTRKLATHSVRPNHLPNELVTLPRPEVQMPRSPPLGTLWMSLPLLGAVVLNRLQAVLFGERQRSAFKVADTAAARLIRLEATADTHTLELHNIARKLDKLQTRVRLTSRDLKLPLKGAAESATHHAELLASLTLRTETVEKDLDETRGLLAALEGVASKQLVLIGTLIESSKRQSSAAKRQPSPDSTLTEGQDSSRRNSLEDATRHSVHRGSDTDEWGRRIKSHSDGSKTFSFY